MDLGYTKPIQIASGTENHSPSFVDSEKSTTPIFGVEEDK
jgi:hypothetical protein